jgi:hypothetical protein
MAINRKGPWRERKFIDLWSLVHFLGGFAIGGILILLDFEPYIAGAIAAALFAGWEIFEILAKIHEHGSNRISDIVIDYSGFFLAQLYVFSLHGVMYWYIPASVAIIALSLEDW